MKKTIAVLPGDGIGPEIIQEAVKVCKAIAEKFGHELNFEYGIIGADAIDKTGNPLPQATLDLCKNSDAILFGAIGHPKYDNDPGARVRPEQGLLKMRKELCLYANIRPVTTFRALIDKSPLKKELIEGVDFVVIRELTGGIYFGEPRGRSDDGQTAFETNIYSKEEIIRIAILAFDFARKRSKKLTVVDKANVLPTSQLWRETIQELSKDYPGYEVDYLFIDNAAMQLIQNPRRFDVVVTDNMFGDILTDEASVITGSLGLLPSISKGLHTSVYEPIHGSYPQATGKNIANPVATILSAALMFEYSFDLNIEANQIREAVRNSLNNNIVTEDISRAKAYSTTDVGNYIKDIILQG
ncbi:3-isopropylmalate dehydrogenase [Bacteroidota bacterium]